MVDVEDEPHKFELKDSIKLMKMSRGYNWEIKIISLDIDALEKLNNEMIERFGVRKCVEEKLI